MHICLFQIDWPHYVNSMLSVTEYQVNSSELVLVKQFNFMKIISELVNITKHQPTGNR